MKHLHLVLGLVSVATTVARADSPLVKRGGSAPARPVLSLAEGVASAVHDAYGQPMTAAELEQGIPRPLFAIFSNTYESSPQSRDAIVATYRGYVQSFEQRWTEVDARAKVVARAVEKAKGLEAARNFKGAEDALFAVLTPTTVDDDGNTPKRQDILLPMDAELPALAELAVVARDGHDPHILPDIVSALVPRRRLLQDRASELYLWLAFQAHVAEERSEGNALGSFGAGQKVEIGRALRRIDDRERYLRTQDGHVMAQGLFHRLKEFGVTRGDQAVKGSVPLGQYGVFDLSWGAVKVDGQKVIFHVANRSKQAVNCHESDKVDGYDPVSRKFSYRSECDYVDRILRIDLTASLRGAPPAWASNHAGVWVLGKVKRGDVTTTATTITASWELTDADVVDVRFLGAEAVLDIGDAVDEGRF